MSHMATIDLSKAPGERASWGRPVLVIYLWAAFELLFVTNAWQPSSRLRIAVLRLFGAHIGDGVVMRPRIRVRFPWNLTIGERSWIGEGVWIHNQDVVIIGDDVVLSQETFLTTGSHRHRTDMGLVTRPIHIESGAWVTSRCMVLGGRTVGRNALVTPMTLVEGDVPPNTIWGPAGAKGLRFDPPRIP